MIKPNELRQLADRFSEGWHDGIKIDASDVMLLSESANELDLLQKDAERYRWLKEYCLRDELFWICKLMKKFPGMSYQTARQEFSENSTQCIAMVMQGGGG